ncbi:hypothetical protein B0H17DRAFT_1256017 [Mycena rosella]|uniref:Uncharacterized protein n=1 Tax=Mycena rosella TaxID=1033263 RepID=A0AAD7CUT7_MYCRO|nr:hypothetical protein B0H17DRAFT_1256017 [Mycena rosella]
MLARFLSLFSTSTAPPPDGVRTIPCTAMDLGMVDLILTMGLVIDARLDAKKLQETLSTVVERKFPRAGGRLSLRNGVYELQVPDSFGPAAPPMVFTTEDYAESYKSDKRPEIPTHPTGALPSPPAIIARPAELDVYLRSVTCPRSLEGFLTPNMPLLHVHVAVFDNLTFIGVTSPHIAFDALGTATLLSAWTRLLNGEELDTIPGMDRDAEPFKTFAGSSSISAKRGWFNLGLFNRLSFIARFVLHIIQDSSEVPYLVRVPKTFLDGTKQNIMDELNREGSNEWVGSSDVLMAWWFKTLYTHRKHDDTTPIHIHFPVDLRNKPIWADGAPLTSPYIHNAVSKISLPPIPANAFQTESLAALALRVRRAVNAYTADPAAIRADVQWHCAHPGMTLFPCPPGAEYNVQTNWRAACFAGLDFSGARAASPPGAAAADTLERAARVVFVHPIVTSGKNIPMRGTGGVLMDDEHGVWMSQYRGAKDWERVRQSGSLVFL